MNTALSKAGRVSLVIASITPAACGGSGGPDVDETGFVSIGIMDAPVDNVSAAVFESFIP
jgi:hypothetical protein